MKRCPRCNADYFDNMLEFCLDDGTKLALVTGASTTRANPPVRTILPAPKNPLSTSAKTDVFANTAEVETVVSNIKNVDLPVDAEQSWNAGRILENAPIGFALAHNWWQWLYLEKQYVYSITDYILSANFLMWFVLLASGAAAGVLAVRHSRNKTLAYLGLVVLAINLILFLVPRR